MMEVRNGSLDTLGLLFERHQAILYNYYVRLTRDRSLSEDLVQEVFLRILKYRHTFRGDGQFTMWMYRIARNVQIDYGTKWKHEMRLDEDQHDRPDETPIPGGTMEQKDNITILEQALSQLADEKREIIILSRYQGMKYTAIAELLGCSVETVKVRVHRAVGDLRKLFYQISGENES